MKFTAIIGRVLYMCIGKHMPGSFSKPNIGQRKLRNLMARSFAPGIDRTANVEKGAVFSPKINAGLQSNIGINAYIQGKVTIGKYVMMGPECNIWTINHETSRVDIPMCDQGDTTEKEVVIDDDVWIGSRATILPGVHIGKGSIIGAGAVVGKDIPEYSVAVGNPVKVIKDRRENLREASFESE